MVSIFGQLFTLHFNLFGVTISGTRDKIPSYSVKNSDSAQINLSSVRGGGGGS